MNLLKVLQHGIKSFAFVFLASFIAVIIGAFTSAMGFKPEGLIDPVVWKFIVLPVLVGIIGALDNFRKHLS